MSAILMLEVLKSGEPVALTAVALLLVIFYILGSAVYELYFSPLSKFPGPKLAAVTRLYETYYDLIKWGQYTFEIGKMHEKYGPIVRISPYELHINDPEYLETLYSRSSPRNKYVYFTRQFGADESTFGTVDHLHHRLRRGPLNPFFAKQRILKLEDMLWGMVEKLCARFEQARKSGQALPLRLVYMCLTTDVITRYSMARSWDYLDAPDFSPLWCETIKVIASYGVFFKHAPWLYKVLRAMPDRLVGAMNPGMGLVMGYMRGVERQIKEIMDDREDKTRYLIEGQSTIFHELINSNLPPCEKTLDRLRQEGQVVVGAGADTTANTLTVITFHLLDNPDKLMKLKGELETVMPTPTSRPKLLELEQLPYYNAVITEGLRLSYGVSSRLARIAPNEVLKYKEWEIPAGTPVGMTSALVHHNEDIFPDSHSFVPERWLEPPKDGRPLDRYLMVFSKGSRACIGMGLAKAEIHLTLAALFRRFNMKLYETTRFDVDMKHDVFLPQTDYKSKGVRVTVH